MGSRNLNGRLELTWMGKDQALIPTTENTYDYTWVDPADPRACQTHYLIHEGHVGDPDDGGLHDNLLITGESGDVLEALTRVPELAEKYVGRVKCVYIDPPFNTGGAFTNYEDNLEHSIWLTMMRDRLVLLKRLLADDGSIWVHLDDSENHRMRVLMDEVFGTGNFVAEVVWQKADSPRNDAEISVDHDVILVYRRSEETSLNRMERTAEDNARFASPDGDPNPWFSDNRSAPHNGGVMQVPALYAIEHPITREMFYPARGGQWRFRRDRIVDSLREYGDYVDTPPDLEARSRASGRPISGLSENVPDLRLRPGSEDMSREQAKARIAAGNWPEFFVTGDSFGRKSYAPDRGAPARTWWSNDDVGHNRAAKSEIKALFSGQAVFATPKPERLLERVLYIATNPGDLVLDCFAGSGTTAAVAHKMGRRWVTCELLPETVAEFTRPRLEKVVAGEDPGGITTKTERVAVADLPAGVTPEDAQKFTTVLGKLADEAKIETDVVKSAAAAARAAMKSDAPPLDEAEHRELQRLLRKLGPATVDLGPQAVRQLRAAARTRDEKTVNWTGGGGFDVARLSPPWVSVREIGGVRISTLTPEATGEVLERSIAAHLGFHRLDGSPYAGRRGRQYLAVVEGTVTTSMIGELTADLPDGATLMLVCDSAEPGVHGELTRAARGSRVLAMPGDLFTHQRKAAQR